MNYIIIFFRFVFKHLGKIAFAIGLCCFFIFIFFPFSDLNDFISSKVSELTQKKVFLQFEDMHINPIATSVKLDQVSIETAAIDHLSLDSITATPSIVALIKKQIGGKINADGLFKGRLNLQVTPISQLESGAQKISIDLASEKLSLQEIRKTFRLSLPLSGSTNFNARLNLDTSFQDQPDGDFQSTTDKFELISANINLGEMGSINLPDIKFKQIDLKGKISNGKMIIESGKFGQTSDDLFGTINGDIGLKISQIGNRTVPELGDIRLNIDLTAKPAFKEKASLFLSFLSQCTKEDKGITYIKCKLTANSGGSPQFSPLN